MDHQKNNDEARRWIKAYMPELYELWFK